MSREYERLRAALSGERLPAVVVDVDALDRNVARHVEMVAVWGKPLRAASKSVRVVSLLRRVLREGAAAFRGVMCFAAREAEYLAAEGFDDFLLAYPPWQASDLDVVARLAAEGKTIRVAVDSREGIERIGGRAPGGGLTHGMNYSCDIDLFRGWAEAVCYGRLNQDTTKRYNAAMVFKRAEGDGIVRRIDGIGSLMARYGEHVASIDLVPIGAPRRDWRKVVTGDGWLVVRHPDLEATLQIADAFGSELRIVAS